MSDAAWSAPCPNDGRSIGVVAHHVASSYPTISGLVAAVATGQPLPPITEEMIHQGNAAHAQQVAACTQAETVALLRGNAQAASALVRGLSDEQLANTAPLFGQQVSARQIAENILVGHPKGHLAAMAATV